MSEFKTAYVFSDGCVLQRNKKIAVFGTGTEGSIVKVTLDGITVATSVKDEKWIAYLPAREAAKGLTLVVACEDTTFTFRDVAVGEVWLAGGQSNMELGIDQVKGGKEILENDKPDVRLYFTPKYEYEDPKFEHLEKESHWEYFGDELTGRWSAVGYLFAKQISEELGVTVGIISCNWGGTSASAWMSEDDLWHNWGDVRSYIEEYTAQNEGKTIEQQRAEYEEYLEYRKVWEPKCEQLYREEPDILWPDVLAKIGPDRYPGPVNAFSPMRPAGLYHVMLEKVIKYSLAGVIYYQGESDEHKPYAYYNLFNRLVARWREDNGDKNLPFIAVQLPMHRFKHDPDFKNWPGIRKAQRKVVLDNKFMGLAVAIDCGEWNNIHPVDKTQVSKRLALQALNFVYHRLDAKEVNGPRIFAVEYKPDACYLSAEFAQDGYVIKGEKITGFEIAPFKRGGAKDEDYVEAVAEILPDNRIRVSSPLVQNPGSVRYLWTNWGEVTLYGANGLPLEPFGA